MKPRFPWPVLPTVACLSAAGGEQHVEIYMARSSLSANPSEHTPIWKNGDCLETTRSECETARASTIADYAEKTRQKLGEPVGVLGDAGSATMRFIVWPLDVGASYSADHDSIVMGNAGIAGNVSHEMAHAFFDSMWAT